ncbi:FkbM family methyltransferase [Mastigocoleus sp. MO_188.B34]|uniref:FkbM family methyltransferase n=1 Tax=Mastigocoleus sp. MO_188.B34 TaxID=3036635 RepID=UPI002635FA88|nr:FkbM family methyltransferase [Mastigocoleus sp. MO_188.B34]MDJ0698084.1 FkbM family methyltransferase [Mastigocoleus sp. MO_188.B34]
MGLITRYFHQFGLLNFIRFVSLELISKIFDSHNIYSYSQTGEDRIITSYLWKNEGFYIDVGCNHPIHYSNTFILYRRGWTGINIDANDKLISKYERLRKRDTNICAVVSDQEKEVVFTEFDDSFVSSINTEHVENWKKHRQVRNQHVVKSISLNTILEKYNAPKVIDLLSIDVEGHDFEVLSSLDLNIYRPRLIVVEIYQFDINNPSASKVYEHLTKHNYKMVSYAVMNGYFLDALAEK